MKSTEKIKDKINTGFANDVFGIAFTDLIEALPFADAREYLKNEFLMKDSAEEEWESSRIKTDDDVKARMLDYLPFAWEKAEDQRGLSADRSVRHFAAWAWLIDDEFYEKIEDMYNNSYFPYGEPILEYIGEKLGFEK